MHESSSRPLTTNTAPLAFPYHLKALLDAPRRIFKPPQRPSVGRIRSFGLTSVYDVQLEDVLAGKHLPPLGLPEFESYLLHERSHENLQFILWFRDYEKQYREWTRSPTYPQYSFELACSYRRAKHAFLTSSAPLELNLPAVTLATLHATYPRQYPPPEAFTDVKNQVEGMLRASLSNFVRTMSANAGRSRSIFAIFVGVFVMCVGLGPILLSVLDQKSRWLRFAALPCFWLGATTFICGLHGVCIVIYLFGDARQLATYEMTGPNASPRFFYPHSTPATCKTLSPAVDLVELSLPKPVTTPGFRSSDVAPKSNMLEPKLLFSPPGIETFPVEGKFPHTWSDQSLSPSPSSPEAIAPFLLIPSESPASTSVLEFAQSPRCSASSLKQCHIFAPLTKTLDQITIRTYWETFVRSALVGLVVACILVGISVAVKR